MSTDRDKFGELPDDWCCRGECCGPGSWCCQRAGLHYHDDVDPPQWVGHPPKANPYGRTAPFGPDLHVVLGHTEEEYEALLQESRRTHGGGVPVSQEPRWHSHPALGITGHSHSRVEVARERHTHVPVVDWDSSNPVMLPRVFEP